MTDPRVVRALDWLCDAVRGLADPDLRDDIAGSLDGARDTIAALRAEQATPAEQPGPGVLATQSMFDRHVAAATAPLPPLPALPDGVRPLVFDGRFAASRSADGALEVVSRDGRDAYVQDHAATVCVRTTSRAESEATARIMHAAAEWHARGYDLVPVRRNDHA